MIPAIQLASAGTSLRQAAGKLRKYSDGRKGRQETQWFSSIASMSEYLRLVPTIFLPALAPARRDLLRERNRIAGSEQRNHGKLEQKPDRNAPGGGVDLRR